MDKYKEAYRDEAHELLTELEASLLELEEAPDNTELIDRVFRALHTIKGSGAMFGFDNIAEFTHELETVFDLVRNGEITVNRELVNLALSARDQIRVMLDEDDREEGNSDFGDHDLKFEIISDLRKMLPPDYEDKAAIEDEATSGPQANALPESDALSKTYRIHFHPAKNIFVTGTNLIPLLDELRELGDTSVVAQTEAIPMLIALNPEYCYFYWDIILTSSQGINAIQDVFIFVADNSQIDISAIDDEGFTERDYKKLGEILVERGSLSHEELDHILTRKKRIGELLVAEKVVDQGTIDAALCEQRHVKKIRANRQENALSSSIRVPAEKLDHLVDMVGELVTLQACLSQKAFVQADSELLSIAEDVERLTAELRDSTMSIRMLPVGTLFSKLRRLVRDLSNELEKEVDLNIEGGETELDKTVIEQLNDPLIHIIRNAIDHGIEPPEVRAALGKAGRGTVRLAAEHSGANVLIRISDDGAGIDLEQIRAKAVERGLISPDADMSEKEALSLIFTPGFSTAKKVSEVSGRGVGLDVVRRGIEALSGSMDMHSKKGKGSTTVLKLPLTLAIIDGLLVKVGELHFVIPLSMVEECVELVDGNLTDAYRRNMMNFRDKIIPYLNLRELLSLEGNSPGIEQVIIVEGKGGKVGFGVDQVIGQHQTVIKTLGKFYKGIEGISGATILGNGSVALILDVAQAIQSVEDELMFL
ncbi:MAG: chemotaxis protein CheA [Desulfobacteraceae bacterium 4572_88]|nr:MAG: chemotaxis protein CheA [Desulfobacteraceae bacterium 4572_88]